MELFVDNMTQWAVVFNSIFEILSSMASLAVGYYAFNNYRFTKLKPLFHIYFSFLIQGAGLATHGIIKIVFVAASHRPFVNPVRSPIFSTSYTLYFIAQAVAYIILIYAYLGRRSATPLLLATSISMLREYEPLSQLLLFFLALLLSYETFINYRASKEKNSFYVFLGFVLLALGHLTFVMIPSSRIFLYLASILQFSGFALFLTMVMKVRSVASL